MSYDITNMMSAVCSEINVQTGMVSASHMRNELSKKNWWVKTQRM
jgi:hypothetical protein